MANALSGQSLSAGYVGNIVALRDMVLGRFTVPGRTMEVLRGRDFTSDTLFAPLPESYSSLLDTVPGAALRCTSKTSRPKAASSSATPAAYASLPMKRPAAPGPSTLAKQPKISQPPKGRGQPFQRKPAGRGSRPGRY